jgi:hypothetical protein
MSKTPPIAFLLPVLGLMGGYEAEMPIPSPDRTNHRPTKRVKAKRMERRASRRVNRG